MNYSVYFLIFIVTTGLAKSCPTDEECTTVSTCAEEQCGCQKGYLLSSDETKCLPYVTEYNGQCLEDAQCEWLGANSVCKFVCTCADGFRWFRGACTPYVGLKEKCTNDVDCFDGYDLLSLACQNQTCTCSGGFYRRGDIDCRKIAAAENDVCGLDIDCKADGLSCVVGKCKKSPRSLLHEPEITETAEEPGIIISTSCADVDGCKHISNAECYDKTGSCVCLPGYFADKSGTECVAELGVDLKCKSDADCTIRPGECVDGACYCRDYYATEEGNRNCIKTMSQGNWNCLSTEWCYALGKYSYCSSEGSCSCSQIADFDSENMLCQRNNKSPGPNFCSFNVDCKYMNNAYCIDEACGCSENFVLINNTCVPSDNFTDLGNVCNDACYTLNSECRNNRCQCTENYVASAQKQCILGVSNLGGKCNEDAQCTVRNAICVQDSCECDDAYIEDNNICYERKKYSSYCNNLHECSVSLGESFQCRNRMCQCHTGLTLQDNKCSACSTVTGSVILLACIILKSILFVFG